MREGEDANKAAPRNQRRSIVGPAVKHNKCPLHAYPLTDLLTKSPIVVVFHNTLALIGPDCCGEDPESLRPRVKASQGAQQDGVKEKHG